jgi:hypothetical protein
LRLIKTRSPKAWQRQANKKMPMGGRVPWVRCAAALPPAARQMFVQPASGTQADACNPGIAGLRARH